jgi:hypothetical protein
MIKNNDKEQPIDPNLIEKIELMGPTPDRDPLLAAQGRERFISELEGIPAAVPKSPLAWLTGVFKSGNPNANTVGTKNRKFAISTLVALIVVFVMVFGGVSATAYASQSALPGDALYPVKTSLEVTQISLANDAYLKAQLNLEFAQRRMNEINELLQQGRNSDVEFAASEFEAYIQKAMEATQFVLAGDPERGAELSRLVSQALLDYAVALKSVLVNAPEVVKPAVEKALLISQDGAGDEIEIVGVVVSISDTELVIVGEKYLVTELTEFEDLIAVGDTVKVHVILTADGLMIAREIELSSEFKDASSDDGNSNINENEDFSDNDNENENVNDNESDANENDNESDDNGNDNESGDNENENESEDNGNENESEDKSNDNDSDDKGNNNGSDENKNDNHSEDNDNDNESHDNGNDNEKDDD